MAILESAEPYILIGLIVIVLLQSALLMAFNGRLKRISKLMRALFTGPSGENLEAMLRRCLSESQESLRQCDELGERLAALAQQVQGCVQYVGLVRYDAFGDASGQQSFSLAMLDGHQNGAIITALFGRQDSRCYGKAVAGGKTQQMLTKEETEALQIALTESTAPAALNGKRG
ncbi:MAG TPA: DUF4446 family protein [Abditibacteriaceae bacterium]|nr:DUF4446 family protein [Abditibacteriaceae bacterium]